jgi:hypothetical protein
VPLSSKLKWPYPEQFQDPWFTTFESMVASMDASGYASREDRHLLLMGGGEICFDALTGELSWSDRLDIFAAITGFIWYVPVGSLVLNDGDIFYLDLVRSPTSSVRLDAKKANRVPPSDASLLICLRRGDTLYFRNGAILKAGACFRLLSDSVRFDNVVPSPRSVAGTAETIVGSLYLKGATIVSVQALIGSQVLADAATLRIRRSSNAASVCVVGGVAGALTVRTASGITFTEGWHDLLLYSNNASGVAICNGVFFELR